MNNWKISLTALLIIIVGMSCNRKTRENTLAQVVITNQKCEYLTNPLGIDVANPRLSWILESEQREQKQTAYQLLVASSLDKLDKDVGDLWNSGIIKSKQSLNVVYRGSALKSRTQYFWKVRISDTNGNMSAWSTPSSWVTGILLNEEWQGEWIQSDLELFEYQKELMKHVDHNMEVEDSLRPRGIELEK